MGALLELSVVLDGYDFVRTKLGRIDKRFGDYRAIVGQLQTDAAMVVELLQAHAPVAVAREGRERVGGLRSSIRAGEPQEEGNTMMVPIFAFQRARFTRPPGVEGHFIPEMGRERDIAAGEKPLSFYWEKVGHWAYFSSVYSPGYRPETDWVRDALDIAEADIGADFTTTITDMTDNA